MRRPLLAIPAGLLIVVTTVSAACGPSVGADATRNPPAAPPQPVQQQPQPPQPEPPKPEPAKPDQPVATGEKKEDGLWFKVPFDRGEGSLRLARQDSLLRVDVHAKLPYYAGDAQRDKGSVVDLALSVDGNNGRHLIYYPSPAWQPQPEPLAYRTEATYSKAGGFTRLTEQPSFGATSNVKFWDEWKATLFIDLRLVVVTGSTPASVADTWRAALVVGNTAARVAFPAGVNEMNPALTPERMITFKVSELPALPADDENPREAAIEHEAAMQEGMRAVTGLAIKRDFPGMQKKVRECVKAWPDALWARFLDYLIARVGFENDMSDMDTAYLPLMKAYLDACPGQTQVHLDYLGVLVGQGQVPDAEKHFAALAESPLVKGNLKTELMVNVRHGATLARNGELAAADAIIEKYKAHELLAKDKDLKALYDALVQAAKTARTQWEDELKFREDDAKKKNPRLTVETSKGKFVIELFEDDAPNTTASMVALAQAKFYDGLTFHRFVQNFVIQGGCPKGDGTGDPGYRLKSEVSKRNHFKGMVGMACTGPRTNTEGSQFYVCLSNNASVKNLSGNYVIVGRVIEGMEVVEQLKVGDKMTSVVAGNLRDHEYKPVKITD